MDNCWRRPLRDSTSCASTRSRPCLPVRSTKRLRRRNSNYYQDDDRWPVGACAAKLAVRQACRLGV